MSDSVFANFNDNVSSKKPLVSPEDENREKEFYNKMFEHLLKVVLDSWRDMRKKRPNIGLSDLELASLQKAVITINNQLNVLLLLDSYEEAVTLIRAESSEMKTIRALDFGLYYMLQSCAGYKSKYRHEKEVRENEQVTVRKQHEEEEQRKKEEKEKKMKEQIEREKKARDEYVNSLKKAHEEFEEAMKHIRALLKDLEEKPVNSEEKKEDEEEKKEDEEEEEEEEEEECCLMPRKRACYDIEEEDLSDEDDKREIKEEDSDNSSEEPTLSMSTLSPITNSTVYMTQTSQFLYH